MCLRTYSIFDFNGESHHRGYVRISVHPVNVPLAVCRYPARLSFLEIQVSSYLSLHGLSPLVGFILRISSVKLVYITILLLCPAWRNYVQTYLILGTKLWNTCNKSDLVDTKSDYISSQSEQRSYISDLLPLTKNVCNLFHEAYERTGLHDKRLSQDRECSLPIHQSAAR
jgi:hypothetical protein